MTQTIVNVTEARDNLSEILGRVKFGEEVITIEKKGKPYAVVMSPGEYNRYKDLARKAFGAVVAEIQARNTTVNEAELLKNVTDVVEDVRQKQYAREKQDATGRD